MSGLSTIKRPTNEAAPELKRADAPTEPDRKRGWFRFARLRLGLTPLEAAQFWVVQAYLFFQLSMLDEEIELLKTVRPRFLLGALALALVFGPRIAGLTQANRTARLAKRPTAWVLAYLAALFLSTLWAFDAGAAREAFKNLVIMILSYFFLLSVIRTRGQFLVTVLTFCVGGGMFLSMSFWEYIGGRHDYAQGVIRMVGIGGSYADPNSFGATVVLLLPLMVWVAVHSRALLIKACALGYSGLALMAAFYTSSRSALVLCVMTAVWAVFQLRSQGARVVVLGLMVVLGVAMVAGLSESQVKRIQSLVSSDTYRKEESTVGRIDGYVVGWRIFRENPLNGVGPDNWSIYRVKRVDGDPLLPHNLIGQSLATRGFLGTVTFFGFLVVWVMLGLQTIKKRKRLPEPTRWDEAVIGFSRAMIFGAFLLLVSGLGAHNMDRPNWFWYPALLFACLASQVVREDYDESALEESEQVLA